MHLQFMALQDNSIFFVVKHFYKACYLLAHILLYLNIALHVLLFFIHLPHSLVQLLLKNSIISKTTLQKCLN